MSLYESQHVRLRQELHVAASRRADASLGLHPVETFGEDARSQACSYVQEQPAARAGVNSKREDRISNPRTAYRVIRFRRLEEDIRYTATRC